MTDMCGRIAQESAQVSRVFVTAMTKGRGMVFNEPVQVLGIASGALLVVLGVWTMIVVWQPDALGGRVEGLYDRMSFMPSEEVRARRRASRRQNPGAVLVFAAVITAMGLWVFWTSR